MLYNKYNYMNIYFSFDNVKSIQSILPLLFIKLGHMNITSICIPVYEVGLDYLKACSILYLLLYFHISICMYHIFINHPDQGWTSLITFDLCCKISSFLLELSRHFTLNLFFFSLDLFTTFRSRKVQFQSCLK